MKNILDFGMLLALVGFIAKKPGRNCCGDVLGVWGGGPGPDLEAGVAGRSGGARRGGSVGQTASCSPASLFSQLMFQLCFFFFFLC